MDSHQPQPDRFYQIRDQAWETAAMLAGMELDLFTPLDSSPLSIDQLASCLKIDAERLGPLVYALTLFGLLQEADGFFSNTPETSRYFVRGKQHFIGEAAKIWKNNLLAALSTAETIRSGLPQAKYDWKGMDRDRLEVLMEGMAAHDAECARRLSREFDFSHYRSLVDAGCGSGALAIALTQIHPQLNATVVDLPHVTPITERTVQRSQAQDRVTVISADLTEDPLQGNFDAAILSSIIQVVSPAEARQIILNVGATVTPGGWIFIFGSGILRDSRISPRAAVALNLVFINTYDGGRSYTESEYRSWLTEAGFINIVVDFDNLIITAQKSPIA